MEAHRELDSRVCTGMWRTPTVRRAAQGDKATRDKDGEHGAGCWRDEGFSH